ncbi:hypothetical protein ACYSNO_06570 [Enterococcus sp. LJL98]
MVCLTKITTTEDYQRYHISFSHAIGFTMATQGRSMSKNSRIVKKSMTIPFI